MTQMTLALEPWAPPKPESGSLGDRVLQRLEFRRDTGRPPISAESLALALDTDERAVRDAMRTLRLAGHWIVPSGKGYYLSDDPEQVRKLQRLMKSRIASESEICQALERSLERTAA